MSRDGSVVKKVIGVDIETHTENIKDVLACSILVPTARAVAGGTNCGDDDNVVFAVVVVVVMIGALGVVGALDVKDLESVEIVGRFVEVLASKLVGEGVVTNIKDVGVRSSVAAVVSQGMSKRNASEPVFVGPTKRVLLAASQSVAGVNESHVALVEGVVSMSVLNKVKHLSGDGVVNPSLQIKDGHRGGGQLMKKMSESSRHQHCVAAPPLAINGQHELHYSYRPYQQIIA